MDTFEGLPLNADEDIVAKLGRVWRMLPVGYWTPPFTRSSGLVSHYGSSPSSSAVPSTNSYVDLVAVFAILEQIGGVPTGICQAPDDYRGFRISRITLTGVVARPRSIATPEGSPSELCFGGNFCRRPNLQRTSAFQLT